MLLIEKKITRCQQLGLLDYKWIVRHYLQRKQHDRNFLLQHPTLIENAFDSIIYLKVNRDKIKQDRSLSAVCQICSDFDHINYLDKKDSKLFYLSRLFNLLFKTGRQLHMCYDCGTVARAVFLHLIDTYRGFGSHLTLRQEEIAQIRDEYYMDRYQGNQGVNILKDRIQSIKQNCLFICAMKISNQLGHVYVLEKIYINQIPRYRIYQSCRDGYLLIDYIAEMDYAHHLSKGINIEQHLSDLDHLILHSEWTDKEIQMFIHWFKFYPISKKYQDNEKLFTSTYIIL
ncbi:MAG: hypothetical protein ABIN35_00740 [candidate division WOR-3 bacterium]